MDLVVEIVLEIYMELMMLVVPEKEEAKGRYRLIASILAIAVIAVVFALVIWGLVLILDHGNRMGVLPLIAAFLISAAQIAFGIYLFIKKR